MVNISRLLNTQMGVFFISVMLGLGLATLFRKACHDKNCIQFNGPVISEVDGKTYKFGELCYKYKLEPVKCDSNKRIVDLDDNISDVKASNGPPEEVSPKSSWLPFSFSSLSSSSSSVITPAATADPFVR